MSLQLLPLFLGFMTLFYLFLSMRIGYMRGSPVMKLFFKMDKQIPEEKLTRNVRAHGNFSEYVPLFTLLLLTLEIGQTHSLLFLTVTSLIFCYGRIAHAICFAFYDYNPFLRISGMLCTYIGLFVFAIAVIRMTLQAI
jgi:uncharacterized membrane protein YecN with MAPEG domain